MLIKRYVHIQGGLFGFNDCSFEPGKMEYHTRQRAQSIFIFTEFAQRRF